MASRTFSAAPIYEKISIQVIDRANSDLSKGEILLKTEIFLGYKKGPGCPVPVVIDVDNVWLDYHQGFEDSDQPILGKKPEELKEIEVRRLNAERHRLNLLVDRDLLCAVIPGLDPEDANILSSEGSDGEEILLLLGWRTRPNTVEESVVDTDMGEAQGVDETGKSTSLMSAVSTQE